MFIRTLHGVETTEEVALTAALLATLVGVAAGALAGFFGGWLDAVLMRIADLVAALPAILLILAVIVYLGEAYPRNLIVIFTAIMWAVVARVVRAHVAALRVAEFVEAARAAGASNLRIIFRHLLPNASGTILVAGTALVGQIVLIDATVEFFSLGLPSAIVPSLGNLVSDVVQNRFTNNPFPNTGWWVWVFPCAVLALILVCVNLVGDALDAAFNPATE
jgi:peptide/nickel transport system permease protein